MKIAFDLPQMRPACVLLQAALGGDPAAAKRFDSETWLIAPTGDMKVYEITDEQLTALVDRTHQQYQQNTKERACSD
jgi:hypothetical protein